MTGLSASSQNRWPNLDIDVGAVNTLAGRFVRRLLLQDLHVAAALLDEGLRAADPPRRRPRPRPAEPDPDFYDKMHAHCDVLVVGAGPAGPDGRARRRRPARG